MRKSKRLGIRLALAVGMTAMLLTPGASAFSLLGPYADWMVPANGFQLPGDIGGPMNLGEEYRWNVPAVTYAFEGGNSKTSFLDFFGVGGIQAVDQAFSILNSLPPASQIDPSNYPPSTVRINYAAQEQGLLDLKSQVLALLLEQLGLGSPTRNVACLRSFSIVGGTVVGQVVNRNFDPTTWLVSSNVNDTLYGYTLVITGTGADAVEYPIDPLAPVFTAVADGHVLPGVYYTGLTRDDVGALRYLYLSNNVNLEPLLPDVHGIGTNATSFVSTALRGGVERIAFSRPDYYSGGISPPQFYTPFTNRFTDYYITNNQVMSQQMERVETQPDIIFASADLDNGGPTIARVERTGTTNWVTSPLGPGFPGIIRPQIRITFSRGIGPLLQTSDARPEGAAVVSDFRWASFDASTNAPLIYSVRAPVNTNAMVMLWLHGPTTGFLQPITWELPVPVGGTITPETSTNLVDWARLPAITNHGATINWVHWASRSARFFRILPE